MKGRQLLEKYLSKLRMHAILKSSICGLLVGFSAEFLVAFISWFIGYAAGTWISIGVAVLAAVISGVIFYFVKFRPTDKVLGHSVDRLGLKERIITMLEYEKDESYIANLQREDAEKSLSTVTPKGLKFAIARKIVIGVIVAAILAPSMTVVCELAARGLINSGLGLIDPEYDGIVEITVVYEADEGGSIDGDEIQIIYRGENPEPVKALPDDGWMFVEWSDGNTDPYRTDKEPQSDVTYTAIFEEVEPDGEEDSPGGGDGKGGGKGEGDGAGDAPGEGGKSENSSDTEGESDGAGNKPGEKPTDSAGGKYEAKNQILDGRTYYKEYLDIFREEVRMLIESGEEIPPELREFIETYFGSV